jgi:hypothetical protein
MAKAPDSEASPRPGEGGDRAGRRGSGDLERDRRNRLNLRLAEAAWRDADRRRSYEWKLNFALWPALGALGGFFWKQNPQFAPGWMIAGSLLIVGIAGTYWFHWSVGLWIRNNSDLTAADYYLARIDGDPSRIAPFPRSRLVDFDARSDNPYDSFSRLSWKPGLRKRAMAGFELLRHWSHGSQIVFTLILSLITIGGMLRSAAW